MYYKERLGLYLDDDSGQPLGDFDHLALGLGARGRKLVFAMNAGMYRADTLGPLGLFVAEGRTRQRLNTASGKGNFYLKPNGVFLVGTNGARVIESAAYRSNSAGVRLATQSGPLLVRRGKPHPAFNPASPSRLIRNGVGVPSPDVAVFAISGDPVNFHEFARFFHDVLHCPDALYLDGNVSGLHAKSSTAAMRFSPSGRCWA